MAPDTGTSGLLAPASARTCVPRWRDDAGRPGREAKVQQGGDRAGVRGPIVVLTGAGISVESGLPSFRGADGLWQGWRLEDVATPEAFARDPALVQRFYDARRRQLLDPAIQPNAAHLALAELERRWPDPVLLVTQNIDDLHERAGTRDLVHMHGELLKARCLRCRRGGELAGRSRHRASLSGLRRRWQPAPPRGLVRRAAARARRGSTPRSRPARCSSRSAPRARSTRRRASSRRCAPQAGHTRSSSTSSRASPAHCSPNNAMAGRPSSSRAWSPSCLPSWALTDRARGRVATSTVFTHDGGSASAARRPAGRLMRLRGILNTCRAGRTDRSTRPRPRSCHGAHAAICRGAGFTPGGAGSKCRLHRLIGGTSPACPHDNACNS